MARSFLLLLAVSLLIAAPLPGPPSAAGELATTHPAHHSRGVQPRLRAPLLRHTPVRRPVNPRPSSVLLMDETRRGLEDFKLVKPLTKACRDGRFRQVRDRRYIAKVQGMTYGAGLGGHASLYDPDRRAMGGMVYIFKNEDSSRCLVYLLGARTG